MSPILLLPNDPNFQETLEYLEVLSIQEMSDLNLGFNFAVRIQSGLLEPIIDSELREYIYGGEYDERLAAIAFSEGI